MPGRKLGRGLDMLIATEREAKSEKGEVLALDPLSVQPNPEQPRKTWREQDLGELKTSIEREGVLQPILVRKVGDSYQLVAGERRLRAAIELGLESIPALSVAIDSERLLEVALIENLQRQDLNPIELAQAYGRLMGLRDWTQEALAEALGVGRSAVANAIRLLALPDEMQNALVRGQITLGHAKVLASVADDAERRQLFERIAEDKLSVRELEGERKVTESSDTTPAAEGKKRRSRRSGEKSPQIVSLEERFSEKLGTRVRISEKRGKGRVTIDFYSTDDFERLRKMILG